MKKYWEITDNTKIIFKDLFNVVKENLSIEEVKMIWLLRNSRHGATYEFFLLAKKFYAAHKSKIELLKSLDK